MLDAALQAVSRVRRDDPSTSYGAASRAGTLASVHQEAIMACLRMQTAPIGATAIGSLTGLTQVQVCRRLPELLEDGRVRICEGVAPTASGRSERLWRIAMQPSADSGAYLGSAAL